MLKHFFSYFLYQKGKKIYLARVNINKIGKIVGTEIIASEEIRSSNIGCTSTPRFFLILLKTSAAVLSSLPK